MDNRFSPATSPNSSLGQPDITMLSDFQIACNHVKLHIDPKYHGSLDQPQAMLGGITPYEHLRRGGCRDTIVNMFQPGRGA